MTHPNPADLMERLAAAARGAESFNRPWEQFARFLDQEARDLRASEGEGAGHVVGESSFWCGWCQNFVRHPHPLQQHDPIHISAQAGGAAGAGVRSSEPENVRREAHPPSPHFPGACELWPGCRCVLACVRTAGSGAFPSPPCSPAPAPATAGGRGTGAETKACWEWLMARARHRHAKAPNASITDQTWEGRCANELTRLTAEVERLTRERDEERDKLGVWDKGCHDAYAEQVTRAETAEAALARAHKVVDRPVGGAL